MTGIEIENERLKRENEELRRILAATKKAAQSPVKVGEFINGLLPQILDRRG